MYVPSPSPGFSRSAICCCPRPDGLLTVWADGRGDRRGSGDPVDGLGLLAAVGAVGLIRGAVIPAHGSLVLSTGKGHAVIEQFFGMLLPGQYVNLELVFAKAGPIDTSTAVIALGAPAPNGSSSAPSGAATSASGATK